MKGRETRYWTVLIGGIRHSLLGLWSMEPLLFLLRLVLLKLLALLLLTLLQMKLLDLMVSPCLVWTRLLLRPHLRNRTGGGTRRLTEIVLLT